MKIVLWGLTPYLSPVNGGSTFFRNRVRPPYYTAVYHGAVRNFVAAMHCHNIERVQSVGLTF